ncbi:50S ribosomal protein L3 [candidate division KSB1 bacterium]|nr:MAG: 50S ribosomal protein L3 [candidate division KSB1 bacterium]
MIGLIGRKLGMTRIFDDKGNAIPVTVIELGPNQITGLRTSEDNGYAATCLGFEQKRDKLVNMPQKGHYAKLGITAPRVEREFRDMLIEGKKIGDSVKCDVFTVGDLVRITGTSKGRGFAGVIKRHGFSGPVDSHGTHEFFRHGGAIGAHTFPGRVWKGLRMPGRMGADRVTVSNLKVIRVDVDANLIMVKGAVPGPSKGIVLVRK